MNTYIIWDWNGTLINDVDAAVAALNKMLTTRNLPLTNRDFYRANFGFPVRPFYSLLGMHPDEEWDRICTEFHDNIHCEPQHIRSDARDALTYVRAHNAHQSILSALRQDLLHRDTASEGVQNFFDEIYGVDNLDGATKLSRGYELMTKLFGTTTHQASFALYFIGDTLHDAEVARALGATPILVDGGHQNPSRLAAANCLVAPTLLDAVKSIL